MAAIYQEARPFTFDQVFGQEHVKEVLALAVAKGRLGHAYLFSGPRGVGKTSTARLLAMAANCEDSDKPCGTCESCMLVRQGNHPDVIELDAASNNSVEDIRDLREKVRLSSMRGGTRVWVLDEAHMLSRAAANALLKTLEEPPDKLMFVLATTEPEKLPATILSRCQHFRFRRLSVEEIATKLKRLCEERNITAEAEALNLLAQVADGAMRDAESLLERLLTADKIDRQAVEDALGLPPSLRIKALADHVLNQDLEGVFKLAAELYHDGFAPSSIAFELSKVLRDRVLEQVSGPQPSSEQDLLRLIHVLDDERERFSRQDDLFALEVCLIKAHNVLSHNLPVDSARFSAESASPAPVVQAKPSLPDFDPLAKTPPAMPKTEAKVQQEAPSPVVNPVEKKEAPTPSVNWRDLMQKAQQPLKAFLHDAKANIEDKNIHLNFGHDFHYKSTQKNLSLLEELIATVFGEGFAIHLYKPGEAPKKV